MSLRQLVKFVPCFSKTHTIKIYYSGAAMLQLHKQIIVNCCLYLHTIHTRTCKEKKRKHEMIVIKQSKSSTFNQSLWVSNSMWCAIIYLTKQHTDTLRIFYTANWNIETLLLAHFVFYLLVSMQQLQTCQTYQNFVCLTLITLLR